MASKSNNVPILVAFGNPLLDISVHLVNNDILFKHKLEPDGESEISTQVLKSLLQDIKKDKLVLHYGAGGASQNTSRLLQWILQEPHSIAYVGAIGNDEYGKKLFELVNKNAGVDTRYVIKQKMTGICLAFINGPYRSLAACLGAAMDFNLTDVKQLIASTTILNDAQYVYVEGFLCERVSAVNEIIDYCKQKKIVFAFNLSGAYLFQLHADNVKQFALECDILFGNVQEFKALLPKLNLPSGSNSIQDAAVYLNEIYGTRDCGMAPMPLLKNKIIVITQGSNPVICVSGNKVVTLHPVPLIASDLVVDTTGAGDAFVAGFLAGIIRQQTIDICLTWGCWVSAQIIKQIGVKCPDYKPTELFKITSYSHTKTSTNEISNNLLKHQLADHF